MEDIAIFFGYFCAAVCFIFNIFVLILQIRHSYKIKHRESFNSLFLCEGSLILTLFLLLLVVNFDFATSMIAIITFGTIFSLFGLFNLIHFLLIRLKGDARSKSFDLSGRENIRHELYRKIFHILLFFGIIAVLVSTSKIMQRLNDRGIMDLEEYLQTFWGSLDGLGMHVSERLDLGQAILLILFTIMTTIFIMNEGARIGKWFFFPLRKLASIGIREKEKETVASYVYFTIGMIFASILIYPIPLFSIVGILCFADTAASLFGRKYGTHKLQFNKTKSWEGAIAGFIVCFIISLLFVGPIWGLAASLVFLAIDLITPIIPISDNIAIPLGITGIYLLLSFLQIPMSSILFAFL